MSRRLALSCSALLVGSVLLSAAAFGAASGGETRKGGTLRLSRHDDLDFVDPALAYYADSWMLLYATCAKLFNYPDRAGAGGTRLVPEVVNTYTVSKDGLTYTFDLKRSFRFQNGARVTAQSFVDAFKRAASPKLKSPAAFFMHEIAGADAVLAGRARTISGVRAFGPYRLQIRLTKPLGDFTARLSMPFFCPILPNTPRDPHGLQNPPGSGPYYVAERVVNRQIVLERNPYYRGDRPANVDRVVWTIGTSKPACLRATEANQVDHCVLYGIPDSAYPRLVARYGVNRPGGQFFVSPRLDSHYFAFNHDRPAFRGRAQIPLEKAINFALDRAALARTFGYLGGVSDDQLLPPSMGKDVQMYPLRRPDPVTARTWLDRAALRPEKLVLYAFNDRAGEIAAAEAFVTSLKGIGIDVDVKYFDQQVFTQKTGTRGEPFDVALVAWSVDYADPASFFDPLLNGDNITATGNLNVSYFDDAAVNARIRAANRLSGDARRRAWADLDADLMRDDPPWAPFFHTTRANFVSRSFGCFLYHPVYGVDIAAACKK